MLISLDNITKSFGSDIIFKNVTAKIEDNDRIGLVGANGAGKTTLLSVITKEYDYDSGELYLQNDLSIGYQKQNNGLLQSGTIISEMRSVFADVYELEKKLNTLREKMATSPSTTLNEEYKRAEDAFIAQDGYNVDVKINTVLQGMGFADRDPLTEINTLSGGEQTRLMIAKLLLSKPKLLILDEPTNHLDFKTLTWLEEYLATYSGAVLTVSHDRYFLNKICNKIWEIDHGELFVYNGDYTKYLQLKKDRIAREQKLYDEQIQEIAKLEDYVARNLVRASTTKMAQSRRKKLENMEIKEQPKPPLKPPIIRLNYEGEPVKDVLKVENVSLDVGENENLKNLFNDISFNVERGQKIAIIGGNGTGKTSLLKALMNINTFKSGKFSWGRGVKYSYYEQGSENMDLNLSVLETLWQKYPSFFETTLRSTLGALGLSGETVFKTVGQLSGGERARLKLAAICLANSNTLVLDEPTNHLDLATKEILEEALSEYTGTIIMVSHDRYLLNKIPDKIIELHDKTLTEYKGNYDNYLRLTALNKIPTDEKKTEEKVITENNKTYNRGKEARRQEAKRRKEFAEAENRISEIEERLSEIERIIAKPETASDYQLLQDLCNEQQALQTELDELMDKWLLLQE